MYITKVNISNIKNIEKLEMVFDGKEAGWHVLLGDNGSGKSAVMRAIAFGLLGPITARSLNINLREWIRYGAKQSEIWLGIQRTEGDEAKGNGNGKRWSPFWLGISIAPKNGDLSEVELLHEDKGVVDAMIWSGANGWFSTGYGPFRRFYGGDPELNRVYFSDPPAGSHLSLFWENVALRESLTWLRELHIKRLENPSGGENHLLTQFEDFINFSGLLPHETTIDKVTSDGVFFVDGNGEQVHVSNMSDGFRSMLSMTFELIRQLIRVFGSESVFRNWKKESFAIDVPGVVLIDEVDAHLHPTWQVRIGQWFTSYFPKMQFIVTTHSPLICRAAEKGSIWRLPAPGSEDAPQEVTGLDRKRLIYGDILDAYGTELFGESVSVSHSPEAQALHTRMLVLQEKSMRGLTNDEEEKELDDLRSYL